LASRNSHLAVQKCTLRQRADIAALLVISTGRKVRLLSCRNPVGDLLLANPTLPFAGLRSDENPDQARQS
jgi:hypothetical protein